MARRKPSDRQGREYTSATITLNGVPIWDDGLQVQPDGGWLIIDDGPRPMRTLDEVRDVLAFADRLDARSGVTFVQSFESTFGVDTLREMVSQEAARNAARTFGIVTPLSDSDPIRSLAGRRASTVVVDEAAGFYNGAARREPVTFEAIEQAARDLPPVQPAMFGASMRDVFDQLRDLYAQERLSGAMYPGVEGALVQREGESDGAYRSRVMAQYGVEPPRLSEIVGRPSVFTRAVPVVTELQTVEAIRAGVVDMITNEPAYLGQLVTAEGGVIGRITAVDGREVEVTLLNSPEVEEVRDLPPAESIFDRVLEEARSDGFRVYTGADLDEIAANYLVERGMSGDADLRARIMAVMRGEDDPGATVTANVRQLGPPGITAAELRVRINERIEAGTFGEVLPLPR